jgi:hypothetical protein
MIQIILRAIFYMEENLEKDIFSPEEHNVSHLPIGALPFLRQLKACHPIVKLTKMLMEIYAKAHNIPSNCQVVQTNFQ